MIREECWDDIRSLEAEKMTAIQTSTGSQYFMKGRAFGTADGSRVVGGGQWEMLQRLNELNRLHKLHWFHGLQRDRSQKSEVISSEFS